MTGVHISFRAVVASGVIIFFAKLVSMLGKVHKCYWILNSLCIVCVGFWHPVFYCHEGDGVQKRSGR